MRAVNRVSPRYKVLLFPLANVLGHLTRTLALAEQLYEQGQAVYVAASNDYPDLLDVVPAGISVISSIEMHASATKSFGQINYQQAGHLSDEELLEASSHLEPEELTKRSQQLKKIIARDTHIINQVKPDAIIMDYHYAPLLISAVENIPVFYLSHQLGYPSLYQRLQGQYPYPLNNGTVLVPSVCDIESDRPISTDNTNNPWHLCGMFCWQGWQRINKSLNPPKVSDVFLFFGSTGCGEKLTPWFTQKLSAHYRLSYVNSQQQKWVELSDFLQHTSVVICHGGHGTVLECIKHKKPMVIIPNNMEQLEIGQRVAQLNLGVLIAQPYASITTEKITQAITSLQGDKRVAKCLEQYAKVLKQSDGAKVAADIVIKQLQANSLVAPHKKIA